MLNLKISLFHSLLHAQILKWGKYNSLCDNIVFLCLIITFNVTLAKTNVDIVVGHSTLCWKLIFVDI